MRIPTFFLALSVLPLALATPAPSEISTLESQIPSPAPPAPQRYCNPMPLPNYPVGRLERGARLGDPVDPAKPGHWRLEHQQPFRELADPSALWHDGKWFVYPSCDMAWVSSDEGRTWTHHPLNVRDLGYAPTIVHHRDRFLLLASDSALHSGPTPLGPFTALGHIPMPKVPGMPTRWDPMLFANDDGRLYFYWGCTEAGGIWGVELDAADPLRLIGQPRQLVPFEPDRQPWQRLGNSNQDPNRGWMEGAWMLKHKGRYFLTYSAGGTEYRGYAMGCSVSDSPLGPFLPQRRNPVFRTAEGFLTGTAHGSFVAGPRGQLWCFYSIFSGVSHNFERRIGFDRAAFDENGELFVPVATATPQALPPAAGQTTTAVDAEPWLPLNHGERTLGSSTAPNLSGRFAADLSLLTWWQPAPEDRQPSLTTKLIAPSNVHAVRVVWRDVGLDPNRGVPAGPFRYRLELETAPEVWTPVVDRSANDQDLLVDYRECPPTRATRARLVVLGAPQGITPAVTEFTVFGTVLRR